MGVRHYISVLLVSSVSGAFALAALVGLSLRAEQEAMRVSGRASDDFRNVESLSNASNELLAVFDILTTEQSGVVLIAQRVVQQCRTILAELGASESFATDPILGKVVANFERMIAEGEYASILDGSDSAKEDRLRRFDAASMDYLTAFEALEEKAGAVAAQQVQEVVRRSRRNRAVILVCGVWFLCGVFALRLWITARLVNPLDALAHAATESMGNRKGFVLAESGPAEIRTLTKTVKSFIESLEREIRNRTHDLEATNLELEEQKTEAEAINAELMEVNTHLEEARADATQATQAKTDFLANMSHEIRTPMTAILGFSENLREGGLSGSEARDAIETIHENGEFLLRIVNDILDMSKIEAGKMEVEHIPCSPQKIVAEVVSLMQVRAKAKKLAFGVEFIGSIPETIHSDPTRLKQILINIIGNAIKFTKDGGIRLNTRFVPGAEDGREGRSKKPCLQFDILDTGVGMTEEQAGNLFQPFAQADTTTTRNFGGTGLGLSISKRFAGMLGGDITIIDTEPGCGTRFRVTIATGSLERVEMVDPSTITATAKSGKPPETTRIDKPLNCRVLLVEDGPANQRLISFVLEKAGAEVTVAENGQMAVDQAMATRDEGSGAPGFDVILMDMQMPVMDGYEAAGLLRKKGYTGPIIALTAHAMAGDRERCIKAGCDDYATKPIDRTKLIETIQRHSASVAATSPLAT